MKLQEEIKALLEKMAPNISAEAGKIMAGATRKLAESGIVGKALKQGDKAPSFELSNALGNMVSSSNLLKDGPLVISFYRGTW